MLLFSRVKLASPGLPGTEEMKAQPDQKWVQQNKCTGCNESAGVFEDSGSLLFSMSVRLLNELPFICQS